MDEGGNLTFHAPPRIRDIVAQGVVEDISKADFKDALCPGCTANQDLVSMLDGLGIDSAGELVLPWV